MSNRCKLTLYSSGTIDMYQDEGMSLTYQIADIRQPNKRNADYSKTIKIPGTHNNNKLFHMIFDVGIDRYFNPNKKAKCMLTIDSSPVMTGYMRMRNIIKKDNMVDYEIEITGRLSDLFIALGDTKVKDIGWADLDHTFSQANQVASWGATVGTGYVYPFIDYGFSVDDYNYKVSQFYPAVYVKEVWDRIFSFVGFQYSSTSSFFTSTYFKSLIMPFNSEKLRLTQSQINQRKFRASRTTHQSFSMGTTPYTYNDVIFNDDTTSPNVDAGGVYNTSTGVWTIGNTGYYNIKGNLSITGDPLSTINSFFWYRVIDVTNTPREIDLTSPIYAISTQNYQCPIYSPTPILLTAGTQIKVQLATYSANNHSIKVMPDSFISVEPDPVVKEGDYIDFSNTIDPEMRCVDFLNSIIKMHNLYFEYDKDTDQKITIDPRPDYYNTTVQDWTQKRDLNRDLEIIPMGALQARQYLFTYKQDKDFLNDKYQREQGETYGQYKRTIDNDFLKSQEKEEVLFSPSPLDSSNAYDVHTAQTSQNSRYFARIVSVDKNGLRTPKSGNPRILYYGGIKQCLPWTYSSDVNLSTSGCTNYPYAGHLDDPITPTQDLCWGMPRVVYYDPDFSATYTNNNLFNKYWKQEMDEISDINSSLVTGYFKLTPRDINMLDFRHIYRFDFQNFRLNKIYDYNPLSDGFTKCEFFRITNKPAFSPSTGVISGGSDNVIDDINPPSPTGRIQTGGNYGGGNNIIGGIRNLVGSGVSSAIVTGSYNSVGANASNISLLNSSGCTVVGGLQNVTIINSSGVTVTDNNTMVVNNQVIFAPGSSNFTQWISSGTHIYNGNPGNVGIGTGDPLVNLHMSTNAFDGFGLQRTTASPNSGFVRFGDNSGWRMVWGRMRESAGGAINTDYTGALLGLYDNGRLYGTALHNNPGSVTGTTNQYIASGTYTPTAANTSNLDATPNTYQAQWMRVGNVVTVSGYLDNIDPTATGTTSFTLTLPIASNITAVTNLCGTAMTSTNGSNQASAIGGEPTNDVAQFAFEAVGTSAIDLTYSYTYLIQ